MAASRTEIQAANASQHRTPVQNASVARSDVMVSSLADSVFRVEPPSDAFMTSIVKESSPQGSE